MKEALAERSGSKCELCGSPADLQAYTVAPKSGEDISENAYLCTLCIEQIDDPEKIEPNHWHCLNESMWSEMPAVKVLAWRMLRQLNNEGWAQNLIDMLFLDEETEAWAQAGISDGEAIKHIDSNGAQLAAGDSVVLIKDLNVKGANFTAKRGTAVRNITLDPDNATYIEGKVNGQQIVILTQYVKKS